MHVCSVAGKQHPSPAVGRRLSRHISESRNPYRIVNPVIGAIDRNERLAEITKGRFVGAAEVLFGYQDSHQAVVVEPTEGMDTSSVVARRCRPEQNPSLHTRDRWGPPARLHSPPVCARCGSATERAHNCAGWENR